MPPENLADRLYEAAFIPELWPAVLDDVARAAGAFSVAVATVDTQHNYRWVCSPRIHDAMLAFSESEVRYENVRPARHIQSRRFSFLRDVDIMTAKEIDEDPIYRDLLHPLGLGWTAGDVVQEPSGHMLIVDLIRETAEGPFDMSAMDMMNRLKPDISRASWFASRLAFKQARNTVETLALIGMAAAVVSDLGGVIEANEQFHDLGSQVSIGAGNRLKFSNPTAETLLENALAAVQRMAVPVVQSIPLPARRDGELPLIVNIIPVRKQSRDIFSRSSAVVLVTKVGITSTLDLQVLRGLFDLTPAEARIAWEIGSGNSADGAAQINSISKETVRTYLKRIMMKTGVRTQAQLVLLLRGLPLG